MKEEEIQLAYLEGFLLKVSEQISEMFGGIYSITFEIQKVQIGGKNS
jgi:hypothetical protein